MMSAGVFTGRHSLLTLGLVGAIALAGCNPKIEPTPEPEPTPSNPVALARTVTVTEGGALAFTLSGEGEPGEALTFQIVEAPQHGTLEGTPPDLTYVPNEHFLGFDAFTFTASAGDRISAPAKIEVEVLNAPFYTITRGSNEVASKLHFTDGHGVTALVGVTGHALISIKADPTDGKLYATTRQEDFAGACNNCLVTLDPETGAATVIGPLVHDGDPESTRGPVPSIAFKADGTLFGFSEQDDRAVAIDKATGAVTSLEVDGIGSSGHGMWTGPDDTLWFINGGGAVYTIDAATGAMTLIHEEGVLAESVGSPGDFVVRGDRNPATGSYWGVSPGSGEVIASGIARLVVSAESLAYIDSPRFKPIPAVHNLAFAR